MGSVSLETGVNPLLLMAPWVLPVPVKEASQYQVFGFGVKNHAVACVCLHV